MLLKRAHASMGKYKNEILDDKSLHQQDYVY
jgi:hypothetical protein